MILSTALDSELLLNESAGIPMKQKKRKPHAIKTLSNRESQATVKKNSNGSPKSTLLQQNQNQVSVSSQNMFECILWNLPAILTPYHSPDTQYT